MLYLVHLSDLHIKSSLQLNDSFIDSINSAIQYDISDNDIIYYICSGDISFSGKNSEFAIAEVFFKKLISRFKNSNLILVPGNHDNNFDKDTSVRESVIKDILSSQTATEAQILECLKNQINFANFENRVRANKNNTDNLLTKKILFDYEGKSFSLTLINSPYCCNRDCKEGQIFIPTQYLLDDNSGADYKIAIIHHTPNWFMSPYQREIRSALNTYDLILFGHEHQPSTYVIENSKKKRTNFVEGGIINFDGKYSSFNLIKFDLSDENIKINEFAFDSKTSIFRSRKEEKYPINNSKYHTYYTNLTDTFKEFLDEPGATFRHPYKETLKLSDIYIPPDIRSLDRKENNYIQSSVSLINDEIGNVIICGSDKYGKTALAKFLFSELILNGYVPIFIDFREYSKKILTDLGKLIINCYIEQYIENDIDDFKQRSKKNVVPIIDNFNLCEIATLERVKILREIHDKFQNCFIFINNDFLIDELRRVEDEKFKEAKLSKYSCFKIKSFGHKLRGQLIKKWLCITDDQLNTDSSYLNKYDDFMRIFDKIVSNNLVPPLPIYFLTALSSFNHFDISLGSYGEYYRALTTLALTANDKSPSELDIKINFLSELAFKFFQDNIISINKSELDKFILYYNEKFATTINTDFICELIISKILISEEDKIYFKYKYILYFFIANYIHRNLNDDDEIDNAIDKLIQTLYLQSSSAILLIILSFVKDNKILEKIANFAKSIFADSKPAYIGEDTLHFNSLLDNALTIVVQDQLPSKSRIEDENFKDTLDSENDTYTVTEKDKISDEEMDRFTNDINSTMHCINIIGQILKSHYGSLKTNQKELLFAEGLILPLRTLGDFYSYMQSNTSMWLDEIKELLNRKNISDSATIEKVAKKFLLFLSSSISYFFISLPVYAFSTHKLRKTYETYFSKIEKSNSLDLIEFYIELRTDKNINFQKLEKLVKKFSNNIMGFTILQHIISDHLYMYRIPSKQKSKIASLLNISVREQVMIEIKSDDYN